jgi:hypothetical protein
LCGDRLNAAPTVRATTGARLGYHPRRQQSFEETTCMSIETVSDISGNPTGAKRAVNEMMREPLARDSSELFPFFCECGEARCYAPVWLPPDAYDEARRADPEWVALADGHLAAATRDAQPDAVAS